MQNIYICVDCGTEEFFVGKSWSEIRDETGWRAYKQNDVWCHSCPNCVRVWAEKQAEMEDDEE